ncbi:cupin domain-containing protein [Streptomyces sp. NRRL F-5126]|uniref:cupin domain-containing protein n=1 Tax=Streptomyces sp. NRRL F-5126 TaxID=1463857 RepID=UPI0004CBDFCB|nr:cupin domain-containing protein [Streptomyces sp. NRRL F-5126]
MAALLPEALIRVNEAGADAQTLDFAPLTADGRCGVEMHQLYGPQETGEGGPAAGVVRYRPGARTQAHRHGGFEIIYVLDGHLQTDAGDHQAGSLLCMEPGSVHAPRSDGGALLLVIWEQAVHLV